jgi:hypothetical protein
MSNHSDRPATLWQRRVFDSRFPRRNRPLFSTAHITLGAVHAAGMLAGILAVDRMRSPAARWSAIAGFGIAIGIGEAIWRQPIERERGEQDWTDRT